MIISEHLLIMKPPVKGGFPLLAISFDFSTDLYQFSCRIVVFIVADGNES